MNLANFLVLLYIFFASWTNAFAINDWLPVYIVVLFLSFISVQFKKVLMSNKIKFNYYVEDFLLIFFFIFILLFALLFPTSKSLNYIAAYFIAIFINYFFIRNYIFQNLKLYQVLNANIFGVFFVSLFCNLEFFLSSFKNIYIQDFIPRTMIADADYLIGIRRVYGFSEEPTYLAWYLETLGLIAIWSVIVNSKNKYFRYLFISSVIITFITTFSASGIGTLFLSFIIVFIFRIKKNIKNIVFFLSIISLITFVYFYFFDFFDILNSKLTLNQEGSGNRKDMWLSAFIDFYKNPLFGNGLGFYSSLGLESPVNYFLFLISENGIFPLILIFLFYLIVLYKVYKSSFQKSYFFLIAIIGGILHLFTQSLFFHPCLWLTISFFYKVNSSFPVINKIE